jgi:hypothetical protein
VFDPGLRAEHRYERDLAMHPELGSVQLHGALRAIARPATSMALIAVLRLGGPLAAGRALRRLEIARGVAMAGG